LIVAAVERFVPEPKPSVRPEPRRAGADPYDVSPFRPQSAVAAEPSRAEDAQADRSWNARMKGVIVAPPLVARGIVLFGDCGGSLQAFRVEDGAAVWEQPLDLDGWVTGPMAAIGDVVAVATMGGTVYAVETETGRVLAEKRFDERFAGGVAGIRNGVVVAAESGRVYALEWAESGWRVRWQAEAKGRIEGGAAVGGRRVWVGTTEGSLLAWDEASGTLRTEVRAQEGAFLAAPATDGTNVFACSASETDSQVICLERGGTVRWKSAVPGRVVFPAAFDRERVVVSSTSGVYAFRRGTGDIAWERRLDARPGAPVVADGRVWIGSYGTSVWSLDPTTGEVVERRPTHWYAPGAGVVVDGMWIFGGYDRWVYCVDTAKAGG
jgi:outer membrane protein assembly factor BamB